MNNLFIDKPTQANFIQAYTSLQNVMMMHNSFNEDLQEIFSNLFYHVKFEHYPQYFFLKNSHYQHFKAGNLKSSFKFFYDSASFEDGHIKIKFALHEKTKDISYKPNLMGLLQSKRLFTLSEEVLKNAQNSEQFYQHFTHLFSNNATLESIDYFVTHFWKDKDIVGFILPYLELSVIEKILYQAPQPIILPPQAEVFDNLEPKIVYNKMYPTFDDKDRHYDRIYPDHIRAILISRYCESEELTHFMEKIELEKRLNCAQKSFENTIKKKINKI